MEALLLPAGSPSLPLSCHKVCGSTMQKHKTSISLRSSKNLVVSLHQGGYSQLIRSERGRRKGAVNSIVTTEEEVDDVDSAPSLSDDVTMSVSLLKTAAKSRKVSPTEICAAFRTLEKAKLDGSNFLTKIGGTESPGRYWMLVFASNKNEYNKKSEGGGFYFPVTAVQQFDAQTMRIENGIFLGPIGNLTFSGKIAFEKKKLSFLFNSLNLTVGSWGPLRIKLGSKSDDAVPDKNDPFYIWFYADDEIIVGKGRSGGVAFWCRCRNVKK